MNAPAIRETRQWLLRESLREYGDLLTSLGISIAEACYRGHDVTAAVHVTQAQLVLTEANAVVKELAADKPGGA